MAVFFDAVVASLFCLLLSMEGSSECVSSLSQSLNDLEQLVQGPPFPELSLEYGNEARLFPNISFSCRGSVVGWSLLAPLHTSTRGRRPIINIWSTIVDSTSYRRMDNRTMEPCLKKVINEEKQIYLYENTVRPLHFKRGNILGMIVRNMERAVFKPYMMPNASFVAYYRQNALNAFRVEEIGQYDELAPLLFLHICSNESRMDYNRCIRDHRRRPQCLDLTPTPSLTPAMESNSAGSGGAIVSETIVALVLGVSLCLALLVVSLLLGLALLYILLSRRRRRRETNSTKVAVDVTESIDVNIEPQPYAEPLSSRAHTPLPPLPSPGLTVQRPTYAVLDGPTPSPPPPYVHDLNHHTRHPPPNNSLLSPQYESIDDVHVTKGALVRQDTSLDCEVYTMVNEGNHIMGEIPHN